MGAGCLRNSHAIRALELSVPSLNLWRRKRNWRSNSLPMTNDLINHGYEMKPPSKPKRTGFREILGG